MIYPKDSLKEIERVSDYEDSRYGKVRLDRNEITFSFSDDFIKGLRNKIQTETLTVYPEPETVYNKLSGFLDLQKTQMIFHTGSDLSIKSIFETYISPKDRILMHNPSYAMYSVYSKIFNADVRYQNYNNNLEFDFEEFIEKIDDSYRMAILENPNGFVGIPPSKKNLTEFVKKCEEESVISLIDEAYYYFHDITAADLLDKYENLFVVRTLSKAFGIAGLRAGYILSNENNIKNLQKVKPMHELTSFTILVMNEILDYPEEYKSFITKTKESMDFYRDFFEKIGVETSKSAGNFICARLGKYIDVDALRIILKDKNILIRRPFREAELKEWVRIGVGPIEYQKMLTEEISRMMNKPQ